PKPDYFSYDRPASSTRRLEPSRCPRQITLRACAIHGYFVTFNTRAKPDSNDVRRAPISGKPPERAKRRHPTWRALRVQIKSVFEMRAGVVPNKKATRITWAASCSRWALVKGRSAQHEDVLFGMKSALFGIVNGWREEAAMSVKLMPGDY